MKKSKILCGILALAFIFSGCSTGLKEPSATTLETSEITAESTETEATAASSETAKAPEPFKFNPHVDTNLISEVFKDEWWE